MRLANIRRGDSVFVVTTRRNQPDDQAAWTVTSVGPKYVTASNGRSKTKFHKDTGAEKTDYSPRVFAYSSQAEYLASQARTAQEHKAWLLLDSGKRKLPSLSDDDLTAIIELLSGSP